MEYPMEGRAMKMTRFFGNKGLCYLTSWVLRQQVSDTLCGTKVMSRRDYARMPIGGKERRAGKSKVRAMIEVWCFLRSCWHGWRILRFPNLFPWRQEREPVAGWREIERAISEQVS
jgi:hypothetical protein